MTDIGHSNSAKWYVDFLLMWMMLLGGKCERSKVSTGHCYCVTSQEMSHSYEQQ